MCDLLIVKSSNGVPRELLNRVATAGIATIVGNLQCSY